MISYPSFATLLLTDEDPYVDVDVIHDLALLILMRREAEVKTTRFYAWNHPALLFALLPLFL